MLTALDIGTSKVAVIVGDVVGDDIEIRSVGSCLSNGMKKGVVINIEEMVDSIRRAVEEAELMAECKVSSVYVGVAGSHIQSLNCHGAAPIRDGEVSRADIANAIETAQAIQIAGDQQVLHVLPRDFTIDGEQGIKDPIGMSGYRLEATVHLITGGAHPIQNIAKCVRRCGLEVESFVLEPIASSLAVLTPDERELGVCLVDIGGGTTDIAVFTRGAVVHTAVIPIAGDHVTNDIAVTLRTPTKSAEEIKLKYGFALKRCADESETVEVPGLSAERPATRIRRQMLAEIIEPRYEELFSLVRRELERHHFGDVVVSGIVLTGGSAKLEGVAELAESVFQMPVRIGRPAAVEGFPSISRDPVHATGLGLLRYAADMGSGGDAEQLRGGRLKNIWLRAKAWLQENF
ncbi:MAG: cell division protein FtsA [Gammaproteobacteria bacterium]|nr:cell division protein FtsA [Gammaproteobacteria bacterium]MDD9808013.1 cell division protein FtsA [Gammaproteobacteria bacterium]MDD9868843.1 cell division protein FtsA [Gammaproteobacteria bacterium]MDD9885965.1 cell division protein FtsA [Gammaproteobacteria bacterium]